MKLEPLYRLGFRYAESFRTGGDLFLLGEGRCEGRVSGRFRCSNLARHRADGSYLPDLHGAIECDGGGTVLVRLLGYGMPHEHPSGRVVATALHQSDDEPHRWLNDLVAVIAGEVRDREVVLDVAELVWEPLD